ncbi:MAG: MATE family efflux transporter [Eubacteriales bacterium]
MKLESNSLKHDFFRFIIPSLVAQWVYALYTMVDGMFVARGVSEIALSGVNIALPFITFLFSLALMFAVGSSTTIAMLIGKGKQQEANKIYTQNLITIALVSIVLTIIVVTNSRAIALFLGATDLTLVYVETYIRVIAIFSIFFIGAYSFEVLIKTDGFPMKATIFVMIGAVLNCILDYIFVILLNKGVGGAAFATGFSQLCVTLLYFTHFFSTKTNMKFVRFSFHFSTLWKTIQIGFSSAVTEMSPGIVIFLFNNYILRYLNEEAIVSYTIVSYINTIIIMSMLGIAQGIQPLVSYHYGAKNRQKCLALLRYALIFAMFYSIVAFIISRELAEPLINIFVSSDLAALRESSKIIFYTFSISFLLCGGNIIIGGFLTSVDRPKSAMAISLCRGLIFVAILLHVMTTLLGGDGIWWVATICEAFCLILTIILFLSFFVDESIM